MVRLVVSQHEDLSSVSSTYAKPSLLVCACHLSAMKVGLDEQTAQPIRVLDPVGDLISKDKVEKARGRSLTPISGFHMYTMGELMCAHPCTYHTSNIHTWMCSHKYTEYSSMLVSSSSQSSLWLGTFSFLFLITTNFSSSKIILVFQACDVSPHISRTANSAQVVSLEV